MKRVLTLVSLIAALAVSGTAMGGIVDEETASVGTGDIASVTVLDVGRTTAFAVGVWSSLEVAAPVQVQYSTTCEHPANNSSGLLTLLAGRFVSDSAYVWVGSKAIAGPWYGWDVCSTVVTLRQPGDTDHTLVAWLNSHNGS